LACMLVVVLTAVLIGVSIMQSRSNYNTHTSEFVVAVVVYFCAILLTFPLVVVVACY
jgi:flagellar biosynthesis protein FliQ